MNTTRHAVRFGIFNDGPARNAAETVLSRLSSLLPDLSFHVDCAAGETANAAASPSTDELWGQLRCGSLDGALVTADVICRDLVADLDWFRLTWPEAPGYQAADTGMAIVVDGRNERMKTLRHLFVKAVTFVGAGPSHPDLCTMMGVKALQNCDVCFYDALASPLLLDLLPSHAEALDVGKRGRQYNVPRESLDVLLLDACRDGKRVVRLKGGDPGIFGRLAEEIAPLDAAGLPYRVVPGVSSLNAATTGTGLLPTRRGVNRGFSTMTPRAASRDHRVPDANEHLHMPLLFFMAVGQTRDIAGTLMSEGRPADEPAAMVFGAGTEYEEIVTGYLADIADKVEEVSTDLPGLLMIGPTAHSRYLHPAGGGALAGLRVLLTYDGAGLDTAVRCVHDYGGIPIAFRGVSRTLTPKRVLAFDAVCFANSATVAAVIDLLGSDSLAGKRLLAGDAGAARTLAAGDFAPSHTPPSDSVAAHLTELAARCVSERILGL